MNHQPWNAHISQLSLEAVISNLGVQGDTECWEAHEWNRESGLNGRINMLMSQRLRIEGNAQFNTVSDRRQGFANIIEKVWIWKHFERPEIDLQIAENARYIDYADTWLLNDFHWLSKSHCMHYSTIHYGSENLPDDETRVIPAMYWILRSHQRVAQEFTVQRSPGTVYITEWMDHQQVYLGLFRGIPCWTLWILRRYTVTLHHIITIYIGILSYMDGIMQALVKKNTQLKVNIHAPWKFRSWRDPIVMLNCISELIRFLSQHKVLILSSICNHLEWQSVMDVNTEGYTCYTTKYRNE